MRNIFTEILLSPAAFHLIAQIKTNVLCKDKVHLPPKSFMWPNMSSEKDLRAKLLSYSGEKLSAAKMFPIRMILIVFLAVRQQGWGGWAVGFQLLKCQMFVSNIIFVIMSNAGTDMCKPAGLVHVQVRISKLLYWVQKRTAVINNTFKVSQWNVVACTV